MQTDVDREIARINETMARVDRRTGPLESRARKTREAEVWRRLARIAGVDVSILVAAMVIGWFVPLGMGGAMLVMALLIVATLVLSVLPTGAAPNPERLGQAPLRQLAGQTELWLAGQRRALPAPARTIADGIGVKLETLAPQLAALNENEPIAAEVRKLVAEQLPELIKGYSRVPESLRSVDRNGTTPDQQLTQGLKLIDSEIAEMSQRLAQGDLDSLATRERFLQIKYRDENADGSGPAA